LNQNPEFSKGNLMENPRVGVAVIIGKQDRLLLIRRKRSHGAGSWAVPGGHQEFGESPAECAVREAFEEVGLVVRDPLCVALTNDVFHTEGKHYMTIWMAVDAPSEMPINPSNDEVAEWGWFAWDELPLPLFLPLENLVTGRSVVFGDLQAIMRSLGV
jgi:8-oxo-dGTP diphosphatase